MKARRLDAKRIPVWDGMSCNASYVLISLSTGPQRGRASADVWKCVVQKGFRQIVGVRTSSTEPRGTQSTRPT